MRQTLASYMLASAALMASFTMQSNVAFADGRPVELLSPGSAVVSAPIIGYGPGSIPIYDLSNTRPVTTLPVGRVISSGDGAEIEYDVEAGARIPHGAQGDGQAAIPSQSNTRAPARSAR